MSWRWHVVSCGSPPTLTSWPASSGSRVSNTTPRWETSRTPSFCASVGRRPRVWPITFARAFKRIPLLMCEFFRFALVHRPASRVSVTGACGCTSGSRVRHARGEGGGQAARVRPSRRRIRCCPGRFSSTPTPSRTPDGEGERGWKECRKRHKADGA